MRTIGVPLSLLVAIGVATGATAKPSAPTFELRLQAPLESERAFYATSVQEAVNDVADNFRRWGFAVAPGSLVRHVEVFADLPTAKATLAKAFGASPEDVPDTFGGVATNDRFFLASPDLFRTTWDKLYGAATWEERTYHRLMLHELTHTAHAQYAAKVLGDEEKMGPSWFFEGFACYSAGQFSEQPALSKADFARQLAEIQAGKKVGYQTFARMVYTLAAKVPVPLLLRHAGDPEFPATFLPAL